MCHLPARRGDVKPENFLIDREQLTDPSQHRSTAAVDIRPSLLACHLPALTLKDPSCRVVLADLGSACKLTENQRLSEQVGVLGVAGCIENDMVQLAGWDYNLLVAGNL